MNSVTPLSLGFKRRTLAFACVLATALGAAHAQSLDTSTPTSQAWPYPLAKTTKQQALAYWKEQGHEILGQGKLALGTGSGRDNSSEVAAPDIDLIDVKGVDFEGIPVARFAFFKDTLYAVQAQVRSINDKEHLRIRLSNEEVRALGRNLEKKYGKPTKTIKTWKADGKKPDLLIWNLQGNQLQFQDTAINATLVLVNPQLETQVKKYIASFCKTINAKTTLGCW